MSQRIAPFSPTGNGVTVSFAVNATPKAYQFDNLLPSGPVGATGTTQNFNKARSVRLFNAGPDLVLFELVGGQGDQRVSPSTGVPLAPNASVVMGTNGATFVAAVSATPTGARLYVTPGEGGI